MPCTSRQEPNTEEDYTRTSATPESEELKSFEPPFVIVQPWPANRNRTPNTARSRYFPSTQHLLSAVSLEMRSRLDLIKEITGSQAVERIQPSL
ncbi:unnamed protein product, partial [Iphiclides podalirius]